MATLDWRPAWNADFGFATPPAAPAVDWVYLQNGHLMRRGQRFRVFGSNAVETACGLDDASERTGVPLRVAANGCNVIRYVGFNNKFWDGTNSLACWKHLPWQAGTSVATNDHCSYGGNLYKNTSGSLTGSTPPTHTVGSASDGGVTWSYQGAAPASYYDETYLARMDEMIANYNARGVYVWMGFDHGDKARRAAGLAYNTKPVDSSNRDHGMMWSATWMAAYRDHIAAIFLRTNTVTGVRYCDNPGIMCWQLFNENGMAQSFISNHLDDLITPYDSTSGSWKAELDATLAAWAATKGWTVPVSWGGFPTKATWTASGNTDRDKLTDFMSDTEYAVAESLRTWMRSYNPNILTCYTEHNYSDPRAHVAADISSIHNYSGPSAANTTSYATRSSVLADSNGSPWGVFSTLRHPSRARVITEVGNFGLNRWDWEDPILQAIVGSLQDWDGQCVFGEGQNRFQSSTVGIQDTNSHLTAVWPSRRLAYLCAAPMVRYDFIGSLSSSTNFVLDPDLVAAKGRIEGVAAPGGWYYTGKTDGSEWEFLGRKLTCSFGTPQVVTNYTGIKDANITAGITITTSKGTVTWKGNGAAAPLVTVNVPSACGWTGTVDNGTVGSLNLSGIGAAFPGLVFLRSQGDYPLYSGAMLLFVHQHSKTTDVQQTSAPAGNWDDTVDGATIGTDWGTEANTRIVVPTAFTLKMTSPVDLDVFGVAANGALTSMTPAYAAGVVTITTSTSYPLYLVVPKQPASRAKARR